MTESTGSNLAWVIVLAVLAALLPLPAKATLTCGQNPNTPALTAVLPTTPISTVGSPASRYLSGWLSSPFPSRRTYDQCTTDNPSNISMEGRVILSPTGGSIDGFPIFETGVPGVGIIVQARDNNSGFIGTPGSRSPALGSDWTRIVQGWSSFWDNSFHVRLVSTGSTIVTGTVTLGKIGELRLAEAGVANAIVPVNLMVTGSLGITSRTCTVSTDSQSIAVPLGAINHAAFSGVGSTAGGGNFNVHLENCSTGLNLEMTFTDGNNPANTSDVLTVTPGTGAATGVGIRITRQDNAQRVRFGPDSALPNTTNQISFGSTTSATRDLTFTATYVQTLASIASGAANAIATFTMSYQ